MAKFCTECGKEIASGVAFCTECGTKAPDDPATETTETTETIETTETVSEVKTEPKVETKPEAAIHTAPTQNNYQAQQTQPVYQQPPITQASPDPASKVVGTGAYFGLMLLFALPIIGILSVIIMSFAAKNKNIKHFARANLIWSIIAFVLFIAVIIGIIVIGNSVIEYIKQALEGSLENLPFNQ